MKRRENVRKCRNTWKTAYICRKKFKKKRKKKAETQKEMHKCVEMQKCIKAERNTETIKKIQKKRTNLDKKSQILSNAGISLTLAHIYTHNA